MLQLSDGKYKQGIRRPKNKPFKEQEIRRARSSPKRRSGSKEKSESRFFFFAFFRKLVSFSCIIEDLSTLDAPLIDSVNRKWVAANNNCFIFSGRLSVILTRRKWPQQGGYTYHPWYMLLSVEKNAMNRIKHKMISKRMLRTAAKQLRKIFLSTAIAALDPSFSLHTPLPPTL